MSEDERLAHWNQVSRRFERLLLLQLLLLILWVGSMLYRMAISGCVP